MGCDFKIVKVGQEKTEELFWTEGDMATKWNSKMHDLGLDPFDRKDINEIISETQMECTDQVVVMDLCSCPHFAGRRLSLFVGNAHGSILGWWASYPQLTFKQFKKKKGVYTVLTFSVSLKYLKAKWEIKHKKEFTDEKANRPIQKAGHCVGQLARFLPMSVRWEVRRQDVGAGNI